MGNLEKCKNCGEYGFLGLHKCFPEWEAVDSEWGEAEEAEKIFGFDATSAAEEFARKNHADFDYPNEMEVWVRKPGAIEWEEFDVTVEVVPEFSATKKEG